MSANKRHHFVPRCYLRQFSSDEKGLATNVFNIARTRAVQSASVRGQCAKNFFYGRDLTLERQLQTLEGQYARLLRRVVSVDEELTQEDLTPLKAFAHVQLARTEVAVERLRQGEIELYKTVFDHRPKDAPGLDTSDRRLMLDSLLRATTTWKYVEDLKACIVENATGIDFVTSDDPAVLTNRYYLQRLRRQDFGLASSGALWFLPLTPRLSLMCYDSNVYTVPGQVGVYLSLDKPKDVLAMNELQYLKASQNLYFADWSEAHRIAAEFERSAPRRIQLWSRLTVLVPERETPEFTRYRPANEGERRSARKSIVLASARNPQPENWFSRLRYRDPIRTHSNGSAAGYVRKRDWLTGDTSPV